MYPDWLVVDPRNPRSGEAATALLAGLPNAPERMPTVVLGGDGFMLRTVAARAFTGTFLGMNTGHLGFLHNDVDDWAVAADALARGAWRGFAFPLLRATVRLRGGEQITELAMNDVYLERSTGQAARLAVYVDGKPVVENLVADGLIVATALGSTAYSYSAGGSPAHPRARILKITPICPHLPRLTAFDLPDSAHVRVKVLLEDRRPVRVVIDGQGSEEVSEVEIETGEKTVELGFFDGHDFTGHLLDKIVRP